MVAAMVFEPSTVRECGRGGRAEVVVLDREVVEVGDGTPPQADVVERAGTDGGEGGVALEEAPQAVVPEAQPVVEEAPQAAVPEVATQGVPVSEEVTAPGGASEEVLAALQAASGGRALVLRPGGRRAAVSPPA